MTTNVAVTAMSKPRTIHDFGGFPPALFAANYPAPGSPELAQRISQLLGPMHVHQDHTWGLDHGTWSVLIKMYPAADIPIVQLSLNLHEGEDFHFRLGKQLASLRDEGIMIIASGNIVHNLGRIDFSENAKVFDWAEEFDAHAEKLIREGDHSSLIDHEKLGAAAQLAIPTPDHYWPLLYILGLQESGEEVSFPVTGIAHSSISMRAVKLG